MTTQKAVAKRAGVSVATVSRFINKVGYISPKIKERIKAAIEELDYKPNLVARSLKMRSTNTIGLVFPDIKNQFFIKLVRNAEEVAYNFGYNVILCITENKLDREKLYLDVLKGKLIDGFIVIPSTSEDSRLYEVLSGENVVFVDRSAGLGDKALIKLDNRMGVQLAMDHLTDMNHRSIGVVNVPLNVTTGYERYDRYKSFMADKGLEVRAECVKFADYSIESGYQKTREILGLSHRPTALLSMSGPTTIGALKAIQEAELGIPHDLSLVGFDEFESAELMNPPVTVVAQPADLLGIRAAEILIDLINGKVPRSLELVLEPELIVRESCREI